MKLKLWLRLWISLSSFIKIFKALKDIEVKIGDTIQIDYNFKFVKKGITRTIQVI